MRFKTRYRFWNVFLVVLAVVILLGCMAFISYALFPNEAAMREISSVPTRTYVIRYGEAFYSWFCFFILPLIIFTNLIAEKKKFISLSQGFSYNFIGLFCIRYNSFLFFSLKRLRNQYPSLLVMFFAMVINLSIFFGISFLVAYITNIK